MNEKDLLCSVGFLVIRVFCYIKSNLFTVMENIGMRENQISVLSSKITVFCYFKSKFFTVMENIGMRENTNFQRALIHANCTFFLAAVNFLLYFRVLKNYFWVSACILLLLGSWECYLLTDTILLSFTHFDEGIVWRTVF